MALSGSSPFATSVTETRKLSIWSEIWTAKSSGLSSIAFSVASDIEQPSSLEGPPQRDLVRVLQVSPDGESACQARHFQPHA